LSTFGLIVLLSAAVVACEKASDQPIAVKTAADALPGVLHLTQEELARTVIEVSPVGRGQLRVPREFTATVQSNESELAEVTTLIRGRVVKVHVDVGQDVKKDALLALLHSTDLGVTEEVRPGDAILLSGDLGSHGVAVLSVREGVAFAGNVESDSAPLHCVVADLIDCGVEVHCLGDLTRGGLASALSGTACGRHWPGGTLCPLQGAEETAVAFSVLGESAERARQRLGTAPYRETLFD